MRVLRVTTSIEPHLGGPSHSTLTCSAAERRYGGVATTLVHTVAPGRSTEFAVAPPDGVDVLAFPRSRGVPADPAQRWGVSLRLVAWLVRNVRRFDVVHVEYVWSVGTVVGVIVGRLTGTPVVLTPHESLTTFGVVTSRSRIRARQKALVRSALLRGVSRVLFTSDLERSDSPVGDGQGRVLPLPIESGAPADAVPRPAARRPLVVGFLGRLHEKKRLPWLIDRIAELGPDVRLVVGGADPAEALERARRQADELGIADRVVFAGFVPAAERDAFFGALDVLAMASSYECFGMVAAEAMAAGVPAVVSDHTGVGVLVQRHGAGAVVAVDDPAGFNAAVVALKDDDEHYARSSRGALQAVADELSPQAYARAVRGVYDDVARP